MKLCCFFNTPSLYREAIYKEIDVAFDCDWFFEDTDNHLAVFNTSILKNVSVLHAKKIGTMYQVEGLRKLIKSSEYTHYLMMGHSRNLSSLAFLISKRLFHNNKKVYLWTHGIYGKESYLKLLWKKIIYSAADGILLYGNHAKELLIQAGFPSNKLFVIHNSLNYSKQLAIRNTLQPKDIYHEHFGNNYYNIVFIGRLTKVKKFDLLLDALALLKSHGDLFNVTFIGDGTERQRMESKVDELGLREQVWFYGACYDEMINAELIFNADICVSPGNIGLTAIHVLMFGCPAITNDDFCTQMPEFEAIKEGQTGSFFHANDSNSLAEKISQWFSIYSSDREKVRQACYKEIDNQWNPSFQMQVLNSVIQETKAI